MTDLIEQFTGGQVRPELEPGEKPYSFDGEIGIEWPAGTPGKTYSGWSTAPFNTDGPITTIMAFTLYCRADDILWAEAEMLTDEDGKPIYRRPAKVRLGEDGKPVTGTFNLLVTEMRVAS
jgi:hypothetical protein